MSGSATVGRSALVPVLGLAALAGCAVGAVLDWPAFLRSWLVAALVLGAAPLAALGVLMTHGLTGGLWGERSAPVWRSLAAIMPLFLLAMLPLLFGLHELFSWTGPLADLPDVVRRKHLYLNEPFFVARNLIYAVCWLGLPLLLGVFGGRARAVHAPGLIVWAVTITFFGVDWLMSLEPSFYSDVFGLMLITGLTSAGIAGGLLLSLELSAGIRQDLANLWLTMLVAWLVMAFSQYLLIWSGNLPHEIGWFVHRGEPAWIAVGWVAFVLFFALPFAVLLSTAAKRSRAWLAAAATSCVAGYVLYVNWLVLPAFEHWRPAQSWLIPLALVAVGCGGVRLARRAQPVAEVPS